MAVNFCRDHNLYCYSSMDVVSMAISRARRPTWTPAIRNSRHRDLKIVWLCCGWLILWNPILAKMFSYTRLSKTFAMPRERPINAKRTRPKSLPLNLSFMIYGRRRNLSPYTSFSHSSLAGIRHIWFTSLEVSWWWADLPSLWAAFSEVMHEESRRNVMLAHSLNAPTRLRIQPCSSMPTCV